MLRLAFRQARRRSATAQSFELREGRIVAVALEDVYNCKRPLANAAARHRHDAG